MKFSGIVLQGVLRIIKQVNFEYVCLKNFINFFSDSRSQSDFNIFQPFVYRGILSRQVLLATKM